jgi:hypothetical protein
MAGAQARACCPRAVPLWQELGPRAAAAHAPPPLQPARPCQTGSARLSLLTAGPSSKVASNVHRSTQIYSESTCYPKSACYPGPQSTGSYHDSMHHSQQVSSARDADNR